MGATLIGMKHAVLVGLFGLATRGRELPRTKHLACRGVVMAATRKNARASNDIDESETAAETWRQQEHAADTVSNEVEELLNMAGSVSLASGALQSTVEPLSAVQKQELARQLGYDSFEALLAASTVLTLQDGSGWCLTRDRSGAWAAWNVYAIDLPSRNRTREEALAVVQGGRD